MLNACWPGKTSSDTLGQGQETCATLGRTVAAFQSAAADEILEKDRRVKLTNEPQHIGRRHSTTAQYTEASRRTLDNEITKSQRQLGSGLHTSILTQKVQSRRSRWRGTRRNSIRVTPGRGGPNSRPDGKATGQMSWVEIARCCAVRARAVQPGYLTHQPCKRASRRCVGH